jgi:hypothetical protein
MSARAWLSSNVDYGRKLVQSSVTGASSGGKEFLQSEPLRPFIGRSARRALEAGLVAASIGMLGGYLRNHRRQRVSDALVYGALGAAIGFAAGLSWETRELMAIISRRALQNVKAVRDEHWLEKNPIDYA